MARKPLARASSTGGTLRGALLSAADRHNRAVLDPDIWWHLRTGQWIVEHTRVPATDPFSTFGGGRQWAAFSWLFEIVAYGLFRALGLMGIWLFRAGMICAVAIALHRLIVKREPTFVWAIGLLALALVALLPIGSERPWHFTILFSIATLAAIEEIRQARRPWWLWLLPLAFALWANLHIQFVLGLAFLGLAALFGLIDDCIVKAPMKRRLTSGTLCLVTLFFACLLATGINPIGYGVYRVVHEYASHSSVFNTIQEHRAPEFRALSDWCLVLLAGLAAFAIGRQSSRDNYLIALLAVATFLAFRSDRDGWVLVLAALLVLTSQSPRSYPLSERFDYTRRRMLAVSAIVASLLLLLACWKDFSPRGLGQAVERSYPAEAAAFLERSVTPGAIYNQLNWGGYLIWRLPAYPVTIDGRTNLHGDERIDRSEKTWSGRSDPCADPEFLTARIIVADRTTALAKILRVDPRFEPIHEDPVAVIFRPRDTKHAP